MAKKYNYHLAHMEQKPVLLFGEADVGASGATTLVRSGSKGFESITRTSQGRYEVELSDHYNRVLSLEVSYRCTVNPNVYYATLRSDTVSSDKKFVFHTWEDNGALADPTNGIVMFVQVWLADSNRYRT